MADEVNAIPEVTEPVVEAPVVPVPPPPISKEEADEQIKDIKIKVFDIMGKQADLSTQWTQMEELKGKLLATLKELEKLFPAA
jgi:hypothetical protein